MPVADVCPVCDRHINKRDIGIRKKAPTGLSGSGCSYSVSVSYMKGTAAAGVLRREGLLQGKVFLRHDDGSHTEVIL